MCKINDIMAFNKHCNLRRFKLSLGLIIQWGWLVKKKERKLVLWKRNTEKINNTTLR